MFLLIMTLRLHICVSNSSKLYFAVRCQTLFRSINANLTVLLCCWPFSIIFYIVKMCSYTLLLEIHPVLNLVFYSLSFISLLELFSIIFSYTFIAEYSNVMPQFSVSVSEILLIILTYIWISEIRFSFVRLIISCY